MKRKLQALVILLLPHCAFVQAQQSKVDMAFSSIRLQPDTVDLGQTALMSFYIINNGAVPLGGNYISIHMMVSDTVDPKMPGALKPSISYGFTLPQIFPGDSIEYQKQIFIDPDFFVPDENNIVIVWPTGIAGDADTTNERLIDSVYVRGTGFVTGGQPDTFAGTGLGVVVKQSGRNAEFHFSPSSSDRKLSIFDMTGRLKYSCRIIPGSATSRIELPETIFSEGIYFAAMEGGGRKATRKFLVIR